jgi:putative NADH-flavin reductase
MDIVDIGSKTMKIALIGASGGAGSRILAELSNRGHAVTAIVRHPEKVANLNGVTPKQGDVYDRSGLTGLLKGHDVVISSVHFTASDPEILISAVKDAGSKRYLVVGGAGSLEVAPGVTLVATPEFPAIYKPEAEAGGQFLDRLRQERELDWTFLSPSVLFQAGTRTGKFRLGGDQLLSNDKGSSISFEDFAVALVDEVEKPAHTRQRFTVGY